jgi:hypothetical protein
METERTAPRVTERDREHFRKLGEWKAESHREAIAYHQSLSPEERIVRSVAWAIRELPAWRWGHRGDEPEQFYERARRLGLYRG